MALEIFDSSLQFTYLHVYGFSLGMLLVTGQICIILCFYSFFWLQRVCVIMLVAILRPYKRDAHNNLDIAMLTFFIITVGASSYIRAEFHTASGLLVTPAAIFYFLISVPFLVAVAYVLVRLCVIFRLCGCIQQCFQSSGIRSSRPTFSSGLLTNLPPEKTPTFPDRLLEARRIFTVTIAMKSTHTDRSNSIVCLLQKFSYTVGQNWWFFSISVCL